MASWEQKARHFAATLPALEREQFERALALGLEAMRRPIVFRWIGEEAGADVFEIGREGEPTREVKTAVRGVWWVWRAIDSGDDSLKAGDLAAPDAAEPLAAARKSIRKTAAQWLRQHMAELEAAALAVRIEAGGIRYQPASSAPPIFTR